MSNGSRLTLSNCIILSGPNLNISGSSSSIEVNGCRFYSTNPIVVNGGTLLFVGAASQLLATPYTLASGRAFIELTDGVLDIGNIGFNPTSISRVTGNKVNALGNSSIYATGDPTDLNLLLSKIPGSTLGNLGFGSSFFNPTVINGFSQDDTDPANPLLL